MGIKSFLALMETKLLREQKLDKNSEVNQRFTKSVPRIEFDTGLGYVSEIKYNASSTADYGFEFNINNKNLLVFAQDKITFNKDFRAFSSSNFIGVGSATNTSETEGVVKFVSNGVSGSDGAYIQYEPPASTNTTSNTANQINISSSGATKLNKLRILSNITEFSGGTTITGAVEFSNGCTFTSEAIFNGGIQVDGASSQLELFEGGVHKFIAESVSGVFKLLEVGSTSNTELITFSSASTTVKTPFTVLAGNNSIFNGEIFAETGFTPKAGIKFDRDDWSYGGGKFYLNAADSSDHYGLVMKGGTAKNGYESVLSIYSRDKTLKFNPDINTDSYYVVLHKGNTNDIAYKDNNNISHVSAYIATDPGITNNAWTDVLFDGETKDNLGEFDITTGGFTASKSGLYAINASVWFKDVTQGSDIHLSVWVNGSIQKRIAKHEYYYRSSYIENGSTFINLVAGDVVKIKYYIDGTAYTGIYPGQAASYLEITQLTN